MEEIKGTVVEEVEVSEKVVKEVRDNQTGEVSTDLVKDSNEELKKQMEERQAQFEKDEQAHQERMKVLWEKEVNLELQMAGLQDFVEFLHFEQGDSKAMYAKIKKFQEVIGKHELGAGIVPSNHRSADKYTLAEKNKDTKTMIGTKLSGLFK